ncbi:MAG: methyltransferase [Nocardioidaceae bacterium]
MGVSLPSILPAEIVWNALRAALEPGRSVDPGASVAPGRSVEPGTSVESGEPLHVVDLGGGTGGLAVAVAELGHRVTVVDPSPDALAALERRAAEAGASTRVRGVLGDAATLAQLVGTAGADGVVCHGVLEVVDEPVQALHAAAAVLRPGGFLSVLATQQSGAVLARILAGRIDEAAAMLRSGSATAPRRFTRRQLEELVAAAGCTVESVRGVRVFSDHISSHVVDGQPRAASLLAELDAAVCGNGDFLPLATQLHLLARRDL